MKHPGSSGIGRWILLGLAVVATVACGQESASVSPTHPAAVVFPPCVMQQLRLHLVGMNTGAGTTTVTYSLTNVSNTPCSLEGYPTLSLVNSDGRSATAATAHGTGPLFAGTSSRRVDLLAGGEASFFIVYRDFVATTGRPCAPLEALQVGLPGMTGQLTETVGTATSKLGPCGTVWVSAIRPGAQQE